MQATTETANTAAGAAEAESWTTMISDKAEELLSEFGPKILAAILILIIGMMIVRRLTKLFGKVLEKREVDASLRPFLTGIIGALLKTLLFLSLFGIVGIPVTSFVAILGAAGLAVGMALSGTLQNFAGGVMILTFKPFKIGDFISAQGFDGVVKEIQIFNTIITTGDNKTVIIPNAPLSSGAMVNYSTQPQRRVDMTFGIGYNDDIDQAKAVLKSLLEADSRVLKDPEYFIAVGELADSSVNFVVRAWVNAADYWGVFFDMQENVKKAFDKEGISIPYPQQDVHMHEVK